MVATEHPDPLIMNTLKGNVARARPQRGKPHPTVQDINDTEESEEEEQDYCSIEFAEFEWVSQLLLSTICHVSDIPASEFIFLPALQSIPSR